MRRNLEIIAALDSAGVDYVVVGGVAVVLRGHLRMTVDLDLMLDLDQANVLAAIGVLESLGLRPRLPVPGAQFADPAIRQRWVGERNLIAFTLHDPDDARTEVDLLAVSPVPWSALARDAEPMTVGGITVRVASIEHLLAMKRHSGRPQDIADVAALEDLSAAMADGDDRD